MLCAICVDEQFACVCWGRCVLMNIDTAATFAAPVRLDVSMLIYRIADTIHAFWTMIHAFSWVFLSPLSCLPSSESAVEVGHPSPQSPKTETKKQTPSLCRCKCCDAECKTQLQNIPEMKKGRGKRTTFDFDLHLCHRLNLMTSHLISSPAFLFHQILHLHRFLTSNSTRHRFSAAFAPFTA